MTGLLRYRVDAETDLSAAFVFLWSQTNRARHGIEESQRSAIESKDPPGSKFQWFGLRPCCILRFDKADFVGFTTKSLQPGGQSVCDFDRIPLGFVWKPGVESALPVAEQKSFGRLV